MLRLAASGRPSKLIVGVVTYKHFILYVTLARRVSLLLQILEPKRRPRVWHRIKMAERHVRREAVRCLDINAIRERSFVSLKLVCGPGTQKIESPGLETSPYALPEGRFPNRVSVSCRCGVKVWTKGSFV